MKKGYSLKPLLTLCFLLMVNLLWSQTKLWIDKTGQPTEDKKKAAYYQEIQTDGTFKIYLVNGKLFSEGRYLSQNDKRMDGEVKYFNKRGQVVDIRRYKKGEEQKVIQTTNDLKRPYKIIQIVYHYEEFSWLTLKDPLVAAMERGGGKFKRACRLLGADAVIGMKFEFTSPTKGQEGRLLIYGTAVKF